MPSCCRHGCLPWRTPPFESTLQHIMLTGVAKLLGSRGRSAWQTANKTVRDLGMNRAWPGIHPAGRLPALWSGSAQSRSGGFRKEVAFSKA